MKTVRCDYGAVDMRVAEWYLWLWVRGGRENEGPVRELGDEVWKWMWRAGEERDQSGVKWRGGWWREFVDGVEEGVAGAEGKCDNGWTDVCAVAVSGTAKRCLWSCCKTG